MEEPGGSRIVSMPDFILVSHFNDGAMSAVADGNQRVGFCHLQLMPTSSYLPAKVIVVETNMGINRGYGPKAADARMGRSFLN